MAITEVKPSTSTPNSRFDARRFLKLGIEIAIIPPSFEKPPLNAYQIFVPDSQVHPSGLRVFSQAYPRVRNEYIFQIIGGVPIENKFLHRGFRDITFLRSDYEPITINEYVIVVKRHKKFKEFVEGRWVRVSGSVSPKGEILNVFLVPDGGLECYFGDKIKDPLQFSSYPSQS